MRKDCTPLASCTSLLLAACWLERKEETHKTLMLVRSGIQPIWSYILPNPHSSYLGFISQTSSATARYSNLALLRLLGLVVAQIGVSRRPRLHGRLRRLIATFRTVCWLQEVERWLIVNMFSAGTDLDRRLHAICKFYDATRLTLKQTGNV